MTTSAPSSRPAFAARTVFKVGAFAVAVGGAAASVVRLAAGLGGAAAPIQPLGSSASEPSRGGAALIYREWETVGPFWREDDRGDAQGRERVRHLPVWRVDVGRGGREGGAGGGVVRGGPSTSADRSIAMAGIFDMAWRGGIKPVTDKLGMTEGLVAAWQGASDLIGAAVDALADRFSSALSAIEPVIDALGPRHAAQRQRRRGSRQGEHRGGEPPGGVGHHRPAARRAWRAEPRPAIGRGPRLSLPPGERSDPAPRRGAARSGPAP